MKSFRARTAFTFALSSVLLMYSWDAAAQQPARPVIVPDQAKPANQEPTPPPKPRMFDPQGKILVQDRPRNVQPAAPIVASDQLLVGKEVQINSAGALLSLSDTTSQKSLYFRNVAGDLLFGSTVRGMNVGGADLSMYSDRFVIKDNGNVAIGSTAAPHRLSIRGGSLWTTAGWTGAVDLENGAALAWHANTSGQRFGIGHTNGGLYFFRTASDPATNSHDPAYDLVIKDDGTVMVNVIEINGADLAENFEVAEVSEARDGMVVSIDDERPGFLTLSDRAYDRRVAGVISGAGKLGPGVLMGRDMAVGESARPVALTGRVYCWADTSGGPIRPGDLMTTSSRLGHARRVTDHSKARGAILGKAMSSLDEETGLVLLLVTLQ